MLLNKAIIKLDIHKQPYTRLELKKAQGTKYLLDNGYIQCPNKSYYRKDNVYFSYNRFLKCFISDTYHKETI